MNSYKAKLIDLQQELESNPFVSNVSLIFIPPVQDSEIQWVERQINFSLDPAFKQFYKETNGFSLKWNITEKLKIEDLSNLREKISDFGFEIPDDEGNPYAKIEFRPFEEIFSAQFFNFFESDLHLFKNNKLTLKELSFRIRPFDLYSEFACMGLYLDKENKKIDIFMLDDHYDTWFSSRLIEFEAYFWFLLKTKGICEARRFYFYKESGHLEMPLILSSFLPKVSTPDLFVIK